MSPEAVSMIVSVAVPATVALLQYFGAKIPDKWKPLAAIIGGAVMDGIAQYATGQVRPSPLTPFVGAIGIGIREALVKGTRLITGAK